MIVPQICRNVEDKQLKMSYKGRDATLFIHQEQFPNLQFCLYVSIMDLQYSVVILDFNVHLILAKEKRIDS